jgi:hypothetical protein
VDEHKRHPVAGAGSGEAQDAELASLSRTAFAATWHCLTGCAIGEVLGMVIATALGWKNASSGGVSPSACSSRFGRRSP